MRIIATMIRIEENSKPDLRVDLSLLGDGTLGNDKGNEYLALVQKISERMNQGHSIALAVDETEIGLKNTIVLITVLGPLLPKAHYRFARKDMYNSKMIRLEISPA